MIRDIETAAESGRYASQPAQMTWVGWKQIIKRVYASISQPDLSLRCAGVAFFSFLSLFPIIACFVLVYGIVTSRGSLERQLDTIQPFVPTSMFEILQERLEALLTQPETGLGVGLLVSFGLALWSGSRGVNALIIATSGAYHERNDRSFLANAVLSLGMTLASLLFIVVAMFAIAAIPVIVNSLPLPGFLEFLSLWARWPVLAFLVWVAIVGLYRVAPHRNAAQWRWISPGAWIATLLWLALSILFSIYVENFSNYSATFGSLSVAVVTLLWIYYSTMVVVIGATINAELEYQTKVDTTVGVPKPMGERGAFVADNLPEQKM